MKTNGNNTTQGQYYLGLDVGTSSIGWAVTDKEYNVMRFKGNSLWGIRLFEKANDASQRRMYRTNRRRLERRKQRLALLEMLFAEEIHKKDPLFFQRLRESNLIFEDRSSSTGKYSVFNDKNYTDRDCLREYPTIYHLRSRLIHSKDPHDVRLVYLALHHLVKYRGHFLYADGIDNAAATLDEAINSLNHHLEQEYDAVFSPGDTQAYKDILISKAFGITQKKSMLRNAYGEFCNKKINTELLSDMLSGAKINLANLFNDPDLKKAEITSISLKDDLEENYDSLCEILGDRIDLIVCLKTVFSLAREAQILGNEVFLSDAKIKLFNENHHNLVRLKKYVRENLPDKYRYIFDEQKEKLNNFAAYSGYRLKNGGKTCTQEEFCAFLKKTLPDLAAVPEYQDISMAINEKTFLPKLKGAENGVISYQIQKKELLRILENASEYLSFLNNVDEKGISVKEKIVALFEFKIPYYIGPLNTASKYSWVVRSNEKIYPWNFHNVVDTEKSAEEFILKLVGRCTYTGDYVIPKDSLLYSEFSVLNEINPLKINGQPLSVEEKKMLIQALFVDSKKKVTKNSIAEYLLKKGLMTADDELSGVDDTIKSRMLSYHDFKSILEKTHDREMVENIIRSILIFGEDKKMLKQWIRKSCKGLDENDISYICRLKYKDWGRFSREFLEELYDVDQYGETRSIMDYLRSTTMNLMQLLTDSYPFAKCAEQRRSALLGDKDTLADRIDAMYVPPMVRRSIRQTLRIVDEITDVMRAAPAKIFIEVTRDADESKKNTRTPSRKDRLIALYAACGKQNDELFKKLSD